MASVRSSKLPRTFASVATAIISAPRENGKQKDTPLGKDLSVAKGIAKMLAARQVAIKAGTLDPREAGWADAESRPITEHVREWAAYLAGKGDVPRHVEQSATAVLRLIESAKVSRVSGLSVE